MFTAKRTAFVLAGGGSRGAVQIGMLEELTRRGIRADRVFGASVGAINGAAYAGNPTLEGIAHLADVWLRRARHRHLPPRHLRRPVGLLPEAGRRARQHRRAQDHRGGSSTTSTSKTPSSRSRW